MAKWLLSCKELNGNVYVNRLPKSIDDHTPGIPDQWFFVGPGSQPFVHDYDGANQFVVVFNFLSHLTARVLDISNWPPTQVNPITTNPISIGTGNPPQGPDDALALRYGSTLGATNVSRFFTPPIVVVSNIFVTGTTYTVNFTISGSWINNAPTPIQFRVWRRPLTGGAFTPLSAILPSPLVFSDSGTGGLQFQYAATVLALFDPQNPNDPTRFQESALGPIVTVDSTTQSLDFQQNPADPVSYTARGLQSLAAATFAAKQLFFVEAIFDEIDVASSRTSPSDSTALFLGRQAFVVAYLSVTPATSPADVVNVKFSQSGATCGAASFGARQ